MHLGICAGSSYRMPANHPPNPGSHCGWDRKVSKYSIYTHIYSRHLQYFHICNYIYILCINICIYIYIYMHKNIITYIDSYRSASKTLSLGFQVRKKHFFHGPFDGDMPVRELKSCRGLSQFCLWKGFQIRFWYGRHSDHIDYSSKLFELFSLVNYYNSSRFAICWVHQDRVLKLFLFYVVFQDYPHV